MSIIALLIVLVVIGVILYGVNTIIPMDPKIKALVNLVVVLATCVWLLQVLGILQMGPTIRVR